MPAGQFNQTTQMTPKDHKIDRKAPCATQLLQAEEWIDHLHHSYVEIQKTLRS